MPLSESEVGSAILACRRRRRGLLIDHTFTPPSVGSRLRTHPNALVREIILYHMDCHYTLNMSERTYRTLGTTTCKRRYMSGHCKRYMLRRASSSFSSSSASSSSPSSPPIHSADHIPSKCEGDMDRLVWSRWYEL